MYYFHYLFIQNVTEKQQYHGTASEVLQQMQKDSELSIKKNYAMGKAYLQSLKVCQIIFLYQKLILYQGKDIDMTNAKIDREKLKSKQITNEKETAKKNDAARLADQFLFELLQIDLLQQEEEEGFVLCHL